LARPRRPTRRGTRSCHRAPSNVPQLHNSAHTRATPPRRAASSRARGATAARGPAARARRPPSGAARAAATRAPRGRPGRRATRRRGSARPRRNAPGRPRRAGPAPRLTCPRATAARASGAAGRPSCRATRCASGRTRSSRCGRGAPRAREPPECPGGGAPRGRAPPECPGGGTPRVARPPRVPRARPPGRTRVPRPRARACMQERARVRQQPNAANVHGSSIAASAVQPANARAPMLVTPGGSRTAPSDEHPSKAHVPTASSVSGSSTTSSEAHGVGPVAAVPGAGVGARHRRGGVGRAVNRAHVAVRVDDHDAVEAGASPAGDVRPQALPRPTSDRCSPRASRTFSSTGCVAMGVAPEHQQRQERAKHRECECERHGRHDRHRGLGHLLLRAVEKFRASPSARAPRPDQCSTLYTTTLRFRREPGELPTTIGNWPVSSTSAYRRLSLQPRNPQRRAEYPE